MSLTNDKNVPHRLTNITLLSSLTDNLSECLDGMCRWVEFGPGKSFIERG